MASWGRDAPVVSQGMELPRCRGVEALLVFASPCVRRLYFAPEGSVFSRRNVKSVTNAWQAIVTMFPASLLQAEKNDVLPFSTPLLFQTKQDTVMQPGSNGHGSGQAGNFRGCTTSLNGIGHWTARRFFSVSGLWNDTSGLPDKARSVNDDAGRDVVPRVSFRGIVELGHGRPASFVRYAGIAVMDGPQQLISAETGKDGSLSASFGFSEFVTRTVALETQAALRFACRPNFDHATLMNPNIFNQAFSTDETWLEVFAG